MKTVFKFGVFIIALWCMITAVSCSEEPAAPGNTDTMGISV